MAPPKRYLPGEGPKEIIALVERLIPMLLDGDHPALRVLRQQFESARIGAIELSGVGFFAELDIATDAPKVEPGNFAGGDAVIELAGSSHGAGCVLFVRDGRLCLLEGYTHSGEDWPDDAVVLGVKDVFPIQPTIISLEK